MTSAASTTFTFPEGQGGLPTVHALHPSGSTFVCYLFGAHVASWQVASPQGGSGQEMLFISREAIFDGKKPIRGGIPLVFPQFGGGALPSHGFARRSTWQVHSVAGDTLTLALADSESTREMWGNRFELLYAVTLGAHSLSTELRVRNRGDASFDFQALLHTYFNLGQSLAKARIDGLEGATFADKLQDGKVMTQPVDGEGITFTEETDRIYFGDKIPGEVVLSGIGDGESKDCVVDDAPYSRARISVAVTGGRSKHDFVVWNPWEAKAKRMGDFGDDEYHSMCCVEPGFVKEWETLAPNSMWSISQTITAMPGDDDGSRL